MTGGDEIGSKGIGSDATSSAQLRGRDGGEVIQTGSWIGSGCGDVCELASCVPRGVVWTAELAALGVLCGVGRGFGMSTWTAVVVTERGGVGFGASTWMAAVDVRRGCKSFGASTWTAGVAVGRGGGLFSV